MSIPRFIIKNLRKAKYLFLQRAYMSRFDRNDLINRFSKLYYDYATMGKTWNQTRWQGQIIHKCPLDAWVYQEIIFETKPDVIIETGTNRGGSALFFANMCDLNSKGKVITIDSKIKNDHRPVHERITYLHGSSVSDEILDQVKKHIKSDDHVFISLDALHYKSHVYKELELYSQFCKIGDYMVVEDTNLNGHPIRSDYGDGPMEAVEEFLSKNKSFMSDADREYHLMTFNPKGYLKRIK